MADINRIHILGASGSGTSTLGRALTRRLGWSFFDTDDYYWLSTNPPFRQARPIPERIQVLNENLQKSDSWCLSGSLCGWGDPLIPRFDAVVFTTLDCEIRMARLKRREVLRFGEAIGENGVMHQSSQAFLDWASRYDTAGLEIRSRERHEQWLSQLICPILRIDTQEPIEKCRDLVLGKWGLEQDCQEN